MLALVTALTLVAVLIIWFLPRVQVMELRNSISAERRKELENEFRKTISQVLGGILVIAGFVFTWQQILVSRERETTDRFSQAIGYLGNQQPHVRIGGVYALGRILRDSRGESATVVEILAAFIRENAAWRDNPISQYLRPEIQAALKVIGERPNTDDEGRQRYPLDLSYTDLRRGRLSRGRFAGARMLRTHLEAADLEGTDLRSSQLQGSHLDLCNATS